MRVLGWDIGGSNTKVCRVEGGRVVTSLSRPFEVKHAPDRLPALLQALAAEAADGASIDAHAITMTAELSRNFLTKREGVRHVLDAIDAAFDHATIRVFTVDGLFLRLEEARCDPLRVAAANWAATALLVSRRYPEAILVDIGSTTTDIVPIVGGRTAAVGRSDLERLASGELLYTGAVRTPVEALTAEVSLGGTRFALAAEGFATTGDVHLWRGSLPASPEWATADGRPCDRGGAGVRLARALCSDRDSMDDAAVSALADALADAQHARIAGAIRRVADRHPSADRVVVAGIGDFIGARAARAAGMPAYRLDADYGEAAACAPAAAVALLWARHDLSTTAAPAATADTATLTTVVKVGGGLLAHDAALAAVLDVLDRSSRTLVVPGGGPFADVVRDTYRRGVVDDHAAHWMATLAMDQYAELLASRLARGRVVTHLHDAQEALVAGRVPVLAPFRWLRASDPLPHSWDVTSDSIAAWVAGCAQADRLVLVKPPVVSATPLDAAFHSICPPQLQVELVTGSESDRLAALAGAAPPRTGLNGDGGKPVY